jgi:acetyltransferase-like isoleucine patch superfamily enzyme
MLGSTSLAVELWDSGRFDGAVIAFNANLDERMALFEELTGRGVRFTNVVDVTSIIRLNVRMGVGNVILASSYFGPYAKIGDNNFLSAGTHIEHHCRLGNHCAFGPAVTFSGRVTVGNKVRFGTNIAAEPDVEIGDNCVIASGSILTRSIPANSIVKARVDYTIRPR